MNRTEFAPELRSESTISHSSLKINSGTPNKIEEEFLAINPRESAK
jgi:hypothetical protein